MTGDGETLQKEASALYESAQDHKRASSFHRRKARAKMIELARLRKIAAANGINVITTQTKDK